MRFPRHDGAHLEAVALNTAGGLTDGAELVTSVEWRKHTRAVVTSQAAERIYRSRDGNARIETTLTVDKDQQSLLPFDDALGRPFIVHIEQRRRSRLRTRSNL